MNTILVSRRAGSAAGLTPSDSAIGHGPSDVIARDEANRNVWESGSDADTAVGKLVITQKLASAETMGLGSAAIGKLARAGSLTGVSVRNDESGL